MNKYTEMSIEAEQRVPALTAANYYGLNVNQKGFAPCPFHSEKTASFQAKGSFFYCYGCGWHGNVVDFVMDFFGLPFMSALEKVNQDFNLGLPVGRKPTELERAELNRRVAERMLNDSIRTAKQNAIQSLWNEWTRLDRIIIEQEPGPYDPIPDQYAYALRRIDYVSDLLDRYDSKRERGW